jgi:hypothetical protein
MKQSKKSYINAAGQPIPSEQMVPLLFHSLNGYDFTPGMKIIWNWTSRNSVVPYVQIGKLFQYNEEVYFTDSTMNRNWTRVIKCTKFIPFLEKLNIRPYVNQD